MSAPPLTHHEILALAEPFARRGRHVDLAATQRQARRLVFRPPAGYGQAPAAAAPQETLELKCLATGTLRLRRKLRRADGMEAQLLAQGRDAAALLALLETVPAGRHFVQWPGYVIARSYTVTGTTPLSLVQGRVHAAGLMLTLDVSPVHNVAGSLALASSSGDRLMLPEDLLAVLGWNWARLIRGSQGWTSKLRLRGRARPRWTASRRILRRPWPSRRRASTTGCWRRAGACSSGARSLR